MSSFSQPVTEYMTREVESVSPESRLPDVARRMERLNISSVPVLDQRGLVGVVSRTDLLRVGRIAATGGRRATALTVPDQRVAEVMTQGVLVVGPRTELAVAAGMMHRERVHRLYVVDDARLVGVLSTLDLAAAVRDARIEEPIATIMSAPIYSVKTTDRLSMAIDRLERAHVTGLVVVEDEWPVGVFTQIEALAAREMPRDTRVDDVFDQAMICMPASTRLFRAAAQAARLDVRRVVACRQREAIGVVSGLDFAKVVASE